MKPVSNISFIVIYVVVKQTVVISFLKFIIYMTFIKVHTIS